MADIRSKLAELYSLEQLSQKKTAIHRAHPLAKLAVTAVYILCIAAHGRYEVLPLAPFFLYPAVVMALAEIPYGMIFKRSLAALPFCLFAGISNLILDRSPLLTVGGLTVTAGLASLAAIVLRTLLCVSAVLILVAVTPFPELTGQLRRMHLPGMLVSLFEMVYRYISVLLEEASSMVTAYRLRRPGAKWPDIRHMGSFVGQLLLRSMDRAQRVYHAMQCRGYGAREGYREKRPFRAADWGFLLLGCGSSLLCLWGPYLPGGVF